MYFFNFALSIFSIAFLCKFGFIVCRAIESYLAHRVSEDLPLVWTYQSFKKTLATLKSASPVVYHQGISIGATIHSMGSLGWFVCGTQASNLIDPAYFGSFRTRGEENMPPKSICSFLDLLDIVLKNELVSIKVYRTLGSWDKAVW